MIHPVLEKIGREFVPLGCELEDCYLVTRDGSRDPATLDQLPPRSYVNVTVRRYADDMHFSQTFLADMPKDEMRRFRGEFLDYVATVPMGGWDVGAGEAQLGQHVVAKDGRRGVVILIDDERKEYGLDDGSRVAWSAFPAKVRRA